MDLNTLGLKIARSENLPVLNNVVTQVLKTADDPEASPRSLERIIERDPALTAKILRVSNSSYYGMSGVNSIARAISVLGMNTIRSLVVGVAYQQILSGRSNAQSFDRAEFWKYSLATAVGARILMKLKQPLKSEEMYVAGMMAAVGLLVMDKFLPHELDDAIKVSKDQNVPLHIAERNVLGYDHAQIGAMLAEKSRLNETIVDAVRYHHDPFADKKHFATTGFVSAACQVAAQCGYRPSGPVPSNELDTDLFTALGIDLEQVEPVRAVVQAEIQRSAEAFGVKAA
ncbi:HDOD domain-containing protein [bacterium]|nr:MAG: HDOD domain-containing protein [bacterium]